MERTSGFASESVSSFPIYPRGYGVRDVSLPLKNKKAQRCKPCMCGGWYGGGVCTYHIPCYHALPLHYGRCYHIRLTDTLSVSSYIIIGLLFKQVFGWFSIRHERRYHYNSILFHSVPFTSSSKYFNGWICSRKRQRLKKILHYIRKERQTSGKNNPKKVEKSVDTKPWHVVQYRCPKGTGNEPRTRGKELENKFLTQALNGVTIESRKQRTELRYRSRKSHCYTKPGLLTPELFKGFQTWQQH